MNLDLINGIELNNTFNSLGGVNQQYGPEKLSQDITILLTQQKGKFYPDPDFGSQLYSYLFMPLTESTGNLIREEVYTTIMKYYPQVDIKSIDVVLGNKMIQIKISYSYINGREAQEINLTLFNEI